MAGLGITEELLGLSEPIDMAGFKMPKMSSSKASADYQGAIKFFEDRGYEPHHAAGIVANLDYESIGLNPRAVNPKSGAYGLAQWLGPRRKGLQSFAKNLGTSEDDFNTQLEFVHHELNGPEAKAGSLLKSTPNARIAAEVFSKTFERTDKPLTGKTLQNIFAKMGVEGKDTYDIAQAGGTIPGPPTKPPVKGVPGRVLPHEMVGEPENTLGITEELLGLPKPQEKKTEPPVIKAGGGPGEKKTAATITEDIPRSMESPPWDVLAEVGFVDNPQTKFEILAKWKYPKRNPKDMAKRFFVKGGKYYYLDDEGNTRPIMPEGIGPAVKQFVSEDILGRPLETAGGIAGGLALPFVGGPLGMAAGGTMRRGINELIYDEKKSLGQYAGGAALDFGMGLAGEGVGRLGVRGLNRLGRAGTGEIGRRLAQEPGVFDPAMMQAISDQGKRFGINLTAAEITQSPTLRDMWVNLSKIPGLPRERIAKFIEQVRTPELQAAIRREIAAISPEGSIYEAGAKATQAAKGIREGLEETRRTEAGPYFEKAFEASRNELPPATVFSVPGASPVQQSAIDKAVANNDRVALIKIHGGFDSKSEILKNFAPEERRRLARYARPGAQGPDSLLDEMKRVYPGMFDEFDTDADMLRGLLNGQLKKTPKNFDEYYDIMEREAIKNEPTNLDLSWDFGGIDERTGEVNIAPVIDRLNKLIDISKDEGKSVLTKIKRALHREVDAPDGSKITVPESRLEGLHNAKEAIDAQLDRIQDGKLSIGDRARRNLMQIKEDLLAIMKKNPDYEQGMKIYARESKPLNEFDFTNPNVGPKDPTAKSIVKRLADAPEGEFARAHKTVFEGNAPEKIAKAREWFEANGREEEWNGLVMARLQYAFENIPENITNMQGGLGVGFKKAVFKSPAQQEQLKAAMSPGQYERFSDFMNLLETTGRLMYNNSETVFQLAATEIRKEQAGGALAKLAGWGKLVTPGRWQGMIERARDPVFSAKLAEAMIDPNMASKVMQIKRVPYKTQQALLTAGLMASIMGEAELMDYENVAPAATGGAWPTR